VDVDPKLLDPEPEKPSDASKSAQDMASIQMPADKPSADANPEDTVFKPSAPEIVKTITNENPKVTDASLQNLAKMQQSSSNDMEKDLNSVSDQLLNDKTKVSSKSLLKLSDATKTGVTGNKGAIGGESDIPGTKSLDDALSGTGGGLRSGDKIGIRGGALFEFDSPALRDDALNDLKKLAAIIKRYPDAMFTIDGYADSIGTVDYNLKLSQERADSVKAWLLANSNISPNKLQAIGHGSTHFIVVPNGLTDKAEQDRQEKNRRVEIGIKFPR
jgi:outer membrane protein OmpA-like peptidoglycan-associated protein